MKRIKITTICISLLATLSMVGCMCTPGYYSGVPQVRHYSGGYGYGGAVFDAPCAPCGPAPCSPEVSCNGGCNVDVIGYDCGPRLSCPPIVNCRTSFANLSNGVLLIGRGVLDVTAAPFVIIGNLLSSGCQYEVIAHCPDVRYIGSVCQTVEPCCSVSTSGCDSCDNGYIGNGYTEEISYNSFPHGRATLSQPLPRGGNMVIQTSHRESITPSVRFVQPR